MARWILVSMMLLSALSVTAAENKLDAKGVVEQLQAGLLNAMKAGDKMTYDQRFRQLAPLVKASHRLDTSARIVLGRHWTGLDERQKAQFVDTFTTLSVALYASNFDKYSGEAFKTVSTQPMERGQMAVRSVLTRRGEPDIHFDYVLDQQDGQWKIINIVVDGVSDLALKRAEYSTVMEREGFPALIKKLEGKIQEYQNKAKTTA